MSGNNREPRKSVTLGDVILSTDRNSGATKQVEKDGQKLDTFSLKVYIPDDVDQAGIGQPSLVIKRDDFINLRVLSDKEIGDMPEWKQKLAQLKAWINIGPKK